MCILTFVYNCTGAREVGCDLWCPDGGGGGVVPVQGLFFSFNVVVEGGMWKSLQDLQGKDNSQHSVY